MKKRDKRPKKKGSGSKGRKKKKESNVTTGSKFNIC